MNNDKIQCFTCFKFKPLTSYDENRREYGRPERKGKLFSCKRCTRARMLRELRVAYQELKNELKFKDIDL